MITRIAAVKSKGTDMGVLNDWEKGFLESLAKQAEKRPLSAKQNNWLQKIESKVNDAADPTWEKSWSDEKARNLKIAIEYYKNQIPAYFSSIVQWVEENPTKIINKISYQKIAENKYAKKVIKALTDKPKYHAGQTVAIRANASRSGLPPKLFASSSKLLFIIEPLNKALTAAIGTRLYLVLPSDSTETYEIEERWLKKYLLKGKRQQKS